MNTLIVLVGIIAGALALPHGGGQSVSVSQSSLGDYSLKYATDTLSRSEHRNILGEVNGAYSYVDPYGLLRKVVYNAGKDGFRVIDNSAPRPVQDTPEVAFAKADHLLRKAELKHFVPEIVEIPIEAKARVVEIPQPLARSYVEEFVDTPLVRIAPESRKVLQFETAKVLEIESPRVLEFETIPLTAHVARKNHFLI